MASDKQELIQLHQLLAEVRIFANEQLGLNTKIEDLPAYEDTGITSIDIDADVDVQKNAVLALAKEIGTTIGVEQTTAAEEVTVSGETTTVADGDTVSTTSATSSKQITPAGTVEVTLLDVTENGIEPGNAEINPEDTTESESKIENDAIVESADEDGEETVNASIFGVTDDGFTAEEASVKPDSNQKRDEELAEPDVETEITSIEETTLTDNWDVEDTGSEDNSVSEGIEGTKKKQEVEELDKSVSSDEIMEKPKTTIANES